MAVQKSKVTRARRGKRRSHDSLKEAALSIEPTTGETHRRHHVSADGFTVVRKFWQTKASSLK